MNSFLPDPNPNTWQGMLMIFLCIYAIIVPPLWLLLHFDKKNKKKAREEFLSQVRSQLSKEMNRKGEYDD